METLNNVNPMPRINEKAPEFVAKTTQGEINFPSAYKGKWKILFSHPADFTPVCTTEFVGFQKLVPEFDKIGTKLIGLSIDQVFSHIKWTEWIKEKLGVSIPNWKDAIDRYFKENNK